MPRDNSKGLENRQESSKKKQRKSKSKEDIDRPTPSKFVNKSDKGKMVEEEETPAPIVK